MGWKDTLEAANAAIKANNLDEAETLLRKVELEKQAERAQADAEAATKAATEAARLPFGAVEEEKTEGVESMAVKAAYVKKYGEMDAATAQIMRELYKTDNYAHLRATKMAALNHYLRTNQMDSTQARMVLLAPDQIVAAVYSGVPVADGQHSIKATMVEAQDVLGGFLVPEELNQDIVQRLPGLTVVRARARKFNTSRDALSFLVRTGGNKRYIGAMRSKQTSESPTAGSYDTNATWGKINIPVHVNLSKVPVSKSLLEDSSMDIMSQVLMPEFTAEAAIKEDAQFLTGSGADEPQGILNGTAANGAPFNADVSTVTSGAAADLTFDKLVKAPYSIAGQYRARRNPSTAWAWTSTTAGVIAAMKNGEGSYLWTEMYGNNAVGAPDTFRGWAYAETEALAEVAANTYPIVFGDFQGYRIVDRIGMSVQRYEDSATADTDSVVFFCRRRYGGQVAEGWRFVAIKVAS